MTRRGDIIAPAQLKPQRQIPQALQAVCLKAMALDPQQRYLDVEALKKDIVAYLHGFATSAEDAGFVSQLKLLVKRNRRVSLLLGLRPS